MDADILIMGSTGNVGSHVVNLLLKKGVAFKAAAHRPENAESLKNRGIETVVLDYNIPGSLKEALKGIKKIFFLNPIALNQLEQARNVANEAKIAGVEHIVRLSILGANSDSPVGILKWHRQMEEIIEQSGVFHTFLRPSSFMQNFINIHSFAIKVQNAFYMSLGSSNVSYVDARDIAAVAVESLTGKGHAGKIYELTGPEALNNYQIAYILSEATGNKINYIDVPEEAAGKVLREMGMPDWRVEAHRELSAYIREDHYSVITHEVENITGKKPVTFMQFARDFAGSFVEKVHVMR